MSVQLASSPIQLPMYNPTSADADCVEWCMFESSSLLFEPERAICIVTIPVGVVTGSFIFANITFSVNNAVNYTATTFKVVAGNALTTAQNVRSMLLSNTNIFPYWAIVASGNSSLAYVICQSINIGYVAPTPFNILGIVGVPWAMYFHNGIPIYENPGYSTIYQLYLDEGFGGTPLMELQGIPQMFRTIGGTLTKINNCIDFAYIIKRQLSTFFPSFSINIVQFDLTILKKFYLRYGSIVTSGCDSIQSTISESSKVFCLNQATDLRNESGIIDFIFNGTIIPKPLNYRLESNTPLCSSSYAWVWWFFNMNAFYGITGITAKVHYTFLDQYGVPTGGSWSETPIAPGPFTGDGVIIVPYGKPSLISIVGNPLTTVCGIYMKLQLRYAGIDIDISPSYKIMYSDCEDCDNMPLDFYFVCNRGGYDIITFDFVEEENVEFVSDKYNLNHFCRTYGNNLTTALNSYIDYMKKSGKDNYNTMADKTYTVTSKLMRNTSENAKLFEQFLISEEKLLRLSVTGSKIATTKIIVTDSNFNLVTKDERVKYSFTFKFANYLSIVSNG